MAEVAYDLSRFETAQRQRTPRVRVAKKEKAAQSARSRQLWRMVRILLGVTVMVLLVCGVLYTQAQLTELSSAITGTKKNLSEEQSLNAYLTFEIDNMTSQKNIEERAAELGMDKIDNGQIRYYRVEDSGGITVKENALQRMFANARSGLNNLFGPADG